MKNLVNPPVRRAEFIERYTHEDFMLLASEERKTELIDGDMVMAPPAFFQHERLQGFLTTILNFFVSRFDLGFVLGSRYAVYISESQTYEPDILFVQKERAYIITERKLLEAPDLIIEILSASTAHFDRGPKLENYEKAGVKEIWLVDPYGPAGTQFYQRQGEELLEVAPQDGVIHSIVLPNFKLNVEWLWPDANDQLPNPYHVLKELGAI